MNADLRYFMAILNTIISGKNHLNQRRGSSRIFPWLHTTTPKVTCSMHSAIRDLRLTRLDVVHFGKDTFPLIKVVRAIAASRLLMDL